jgi:DNA repair protein RadA/Sms
MAGEESVEQVGDRAERMGLGDYPNLFLMSATNMAVILDAVVRALPRAIIVDSIQTMYLEGVISSAGSVAQVCWVF